MITAFRRFLTEQVTIERHGDMLSADGTGASVRTWTPQGTAWCNIQGFSSTRQSGSDLTEAGYVIATRYEGVFEPDVDIVEEDRILRASGEILLVKVVVRPRTSTPAEVYTRVTMLHAPVQQVS
jgi:head-tail adaptor